MELLKVLILGIIISILSVLLKQVKPEYSLICIIVGSIILLGYILNSVSSIFSFFSEIVSKTGVDSNLFITLIKIIGVAILISRYKTREIKLF